MGLLFDGSCAAFFYGVADTAVDGFFAFFCAACFLISRVCLVPLVPFGRDGFAYGILTMDALLFLASFGQAACFLSNLPLAILMSLLFDGSCAAFLHGVTDAAVDGFFSFFRTACFFVGRVVLVPLMPFGWDAFAYGIITMETLLFLASFGQAACFLSGLPLAIFMSLLFDGSCAAFLHGVTDAAVDGFFSFFRTACFFVGRVVLVPLMPFGRDGNIMNLRFSLFVRESLLTDTACIVGHGSGFGAACILSLGFCQLVTHRIALVLVQISKVFFRCKSITYVIHGISGGIVLAVILIFIYYIIILIIACLEAAINKTVTHAQACDKHFTLTVCHGHIVACFVSIARIIVFFLLGIPSFKWIIAYSIKLSIFPGAA